MPARQPVHKSICTCNDVWHAQNAVKHFSCCAGHPKLRTMSQKRTSSPVKQEASNCWMSGFRLCATASRSSILWYNKPSAPRTCISKENKSETLLKDQMLLLHPPKAAKFLIQQMGKTSSKQQYIAVTAVVCNTYACSPVTIFLPQGPPWAQWFVMQAAKHHVSTQIGVG